MLQQKCKISGLVVNDGWSEIHDSKDIEQMRKNLSCK
jgi:hypothetical protein